jgi:hypothetical protein
MERIEEGIEVVEPSMNPEAVGIRAKEGCAGKGRAGGPLPYPLARNSFALDASTRIRQMRRLVVDESVTSKISARKMRAILDRLCLVLHPLSP